MTHKIVETLAREADLRKKRRQRQREAAKQEHIRRVREDVANGTRPTTRPGFSRAISTRSRR